MKQTNSLIWSLLVVLTVSLLALTGCGGPECADGTVERDGECVLADGLEQCGSFEVLKDGECIGADELCDEEGTVYDLDTGQCVLQDDLAVCGDNEVLKDGECINPASLCDDDGTVYDVDVDRCVLQDGLKVCADDEILTDGECVIFEDVCKEGTTLDIETGTCELQEGLAICENDQVLKDGDCVDTVDLCDEDGTVYDVGAAQCVLQEGLAVCEDDEVLKDGDCVKFDDLCDDDGTVYDVDTGQCVLEEGLAVCADGEVLYDGDCIVFDDLCDEGTTVDVDSSTCVTDADSCGANTYFQDGQCIADDPVDCGTNTELDPNENTCVVTDEVCGPNTAYDADDDRCVPTDEVCEDGTSFSADDGLCYPDAQCKSGDVIVDGICVSPAEALVDDADVVADTNTNPEFGGTPTSIDLDAGDTVFTGTIEPPSDLDGDGELNQHYDVFSFDADAGDWLEISIQSIDPMPNAHFAVYPEADDGVDFYRESPTAVGTTKARQIVIPETGTYLVVVAPEAAFSNNDILAGGDDWDYVGTIDPIATPGAEQVDEPFDDGLNGTLGPLDDNFFVLDISDADDKQGMRVDWEQIPATAQPVVTLWTDTDEFFGEYSGTEFSVEFPDADDLYIIVDWQSRYGDFALDYDIALTDAYVLEPGEQFDVDFEADAGEVVQITYEHNSFGSHTVTLTDEDGNVVAEDSITSSGELIHPDLDDGTYTVTFTNTFSYTTFAVALDIELIEPTEIETFTVSDDGDHVRITQDNDDDKSVGLVVEDNTGEAVGYDVNLSTFGELLLGGLDAGDYSVQAFSFDDTFDVTDVNILVEFEQHSMVTTIDVGPDEGGDVLEITQTNDDNDDIYIEVFDDDDELLIGDELDAGDGNLLRFIGLAPGTYTVYKTLWDGISSVDVTTELITPDPITDFDAVITGTSNELDAAPQDFYAVELDDQTTYELFLEHISGTGWGRLFIYQWDDELEVRMDNRVTSSNSVESVEFQFEANTPYIIRVGNDSASFDYQFDYELEFEQR